MSGTADTFEIAGNTYRAGKLDAIKQLHVVRRLAPLIGSLQGTDLKGAMDGSQEGMMSVLGPLSEALAAMSDADTEYVLGACLGVCQRQIAGGLGWSAVWSAQAKAVMFSDIQLPAMLQLVGKILIANVGDFTSALPHPYVKAAPTLQ